MITKGETVSTHIVINSTVPRIRYVSNGVLSSYDFPFAIFKNSDLKVYFDDTLQDENTYTVSGAGQSNGGSVSLTSVPESGVMITLTRELPIERTTDFQEGGVLRADVLNYELDYQIACQQQLADSLNRSMILPAYAADTNVNLTLPLPSAGKAVVWNAAGTNLENSTVAVNELESTLKSYKESAESAASTAATKAQLASDKADAATTQAQTAATQAGVATTQAGIATTKATEVSNALSTKANKDLDNLSSTGKDTVAGLGMPDGDHYINATLPSNGGTYTAPANGYLIFDKRAGEAGKYVSLTCGGMATGAFTGFSSGTECKVILPVKKNDVVTVRYNATGTTEIFRFVYAKGSV